MEVILNPRGCENITGFTLTRYSVTKHTYKDKDFIFIEGFMPELNGEVGMLKFVTVLRSISTYKGFIDRIRKNGIINVYGDIEPYMSWVMTRETPTDYDECCQELYDVITGNGGL